MTSNKKLQKALEKLQLLQKQRRDLLKIFSQDQMLIPGSYGETYIRCGQPTCHCHTDGGHFATRLSKWVHGKLKTQIVRIDDRDWVDKAANLYKAHKHALRSIRKLNSEELKQLKMVVDMKSSEYK